MKVRQMQMDLGELEQNQSGKAHHTFIAERLAESPAGEVRLMESICERENMSKALHRVEQNGGAPGVDGMKTTQLRGYLKRHWGKIKASLLEGTYRPFPVRRKEIKKPDGGVRQLGIPTVLDRLIQQAVAQVLQELWDYTFSEYSYGFRPGRSQQMAIERARCYVEEGYTHVVDIDLAKFLDTSSHYTSIDEVSPNRGSGSCNTLIRKPFRLPSLTCKASSSPRFTRCNTVWRDTPSLRMASTMGT
jgi:retron-type reverse transcriptase